jgi:hypothetical protein
MKFKNTSLLQTHVNNYNEAAMDESSIDCEEEIFEEADALLLDIHCEEISNVETSEGAYGRKR